MWAWLKGTAFAHLSECHSNMEYLKNCFRFNFSFNGALETCIKMSKPNAVHLK